MVWDIYEEMREMEKRMNRLFREFWKGEPRLALPSGETILAPFRKEQGAVKPFSDIEETDKEIIVTAEIPGVEKGDININTTENSLEISAETKKEEKEEKKGYLRMERSYGKYYRSYALPSKVDPAKTKAKYKNGVLEVRLPKTEEKKGAKIAVE